MAWMKLVSKIELPGGFKMARFAGVELTIESIQKTREWFAKNAQECIEEVNSGKVKVNDPESYFQWCKIRMEDAIVGRNDHTLTFLQRAHYIQTGECVALLP